MNETKVDYEKYVLEIKDYLKNKRDDLLNIISMVKYKGFSLACLYAELKTIQEVIDEVEDLKDKCSKLKDSDD